MYIEEEWLEAIQNDIQKKYSVTQPTFYVDTVEMSGDILTKWVREQLWSYLRSIKYKHLNSSNFELNSYAIDPPLSACQSLIEAYLRDFPANSLERSFRLSYINRFGEFVVGTTEYTPKEVRGELLHLARFGQSNFSSYKDPIISDDSIIYHIWARPESLPNMLKTGYLILEHNCNFYE